MKRCIKALAFGVFLLCVATVDAQDVFVLPNSANGSANVAVYSVNPFATINASFAANPAADLVLSNATGSQFYIISNSGSNTIMSVSNAFTSATVIGNLGQQATSGIVSPNGQYLIVGAGDTIQIYSTSTNASVASTGILAPNGGTVVDVAASLDSSVAFGLAATSTGSELIAVNLSTDAITGTVSVPGVATNVSIGPNDLLYVSAPNAIMVIDPRTLSLIQQISLNGSPGKTVFTPDGMLGLAANLTPLSGTSLWAISLATNSVSYTIPSTDFPADVVLNQLYVVNSNEVLALSTEASALYQIALSSQSVTLFPFNGTGATAAAISSDIATPLHTITQYVFLLVGTTLYEVNLTTGVSTQLTLPTFFGALSVAGPVTTGTPASVLLYGNNQTVAPGALSLPLVVRVTDANGNPLQGVAVSFSTNGGALTSSSATTSDNGFAVTSLTAPSTTGTVTVTVTAGSQSAGFTVNVGTATTTPSSGIAITAGQGQVLNENNSTLANTGLSPLVVTLTDSSGNLLANQTVTFAIASGNGTLVNPGVGNGTSLQVTTGTNGQAAIDFLASTVGSSFYVTTTITATAPSTAFVTFYITTIPASLTPSGILLTPTSGTLTGQAGQTLTAAVQAQVAIPTAALPNVSLQLINQTSGGASATCAGGFALSGTNGTAICNVVLGGVVGTTNVTPNVGYAVNLSPITITVTPGPPATVAIVQGNNQSGKPGTTLPQALVIQVTDAFGNLLSGTPVTWTVATTNGATLSDVISTTDSSGKASALVTLGSTPGPVQITATAGGITQTFTETVAVSIGGISIVSGNNQTAQISTAFASPLVVMVTDANGNPVPSATVTFAVTAGSAILGSASTTTNSSGQASTTVTAGSSAGAITVTATISTFSTSFSLTSRLPGPASITIYNGPDFASGFNIQTISPGGIATISGVGIASSVQGLVSANDIIGPLPTSLAGVSITFNGTLAPIYYVYNNNGTQQVTVQVPFQVQPGSATVVINASGGGSATVTVPVQAFAPGAFTTTFSGQVIAVAERHDGSFVSPTNQVQPGENITFFVTGLGQTTPATATGDAGIANQQVAANLIVGVNNAGVPLISAAYVPGLVGVYAITVQVPSNTPAGSVPLGLIALDAQGNQYWMQAVQIPVQ